MKINDYFQECEVMVNRTQYTNGNFAIRLLCYDEECNFWMPYGNLTTNFEEKLPANFAYVDINNVPNAEEFIRKYKLGKFTGKYKFSGFCCYPLYEFYSMEIRTYVNKSNPHKFIDVKRTADFHYLWRQRMVFDNGVENHVGTSRGGFRRQGKSTINEVLKDYTEVK